MSEKIVVSFQNTAEDYARGIKYIQRQNLLVKYSSLIPFGIIFIVLLILFIRDLEKTIYAFSRPQGFLPFVLAFIIIVPTLLYRRRKKYSSIVKNQFQKQINSSPVMQTKNTMIFDEDGIIAHSGLSSSEVSWKAFLQVTEFEDYFYFFTAKKIALIIPKRAFENETQQNQLRNLVKRKLGDKGKI